MNTDTTAPSGLKGLVVAETSIGSVRGSEGFYHYREFDATDLARNTTFEAIAHLLIHGTLPDDVQTAAFQRRLGAARVLSGAVLDLLRSVASRSRSPFATLQALLPLLTNPNPTLDLTHDERVEATLDVIGAVPSVLAAAHRLQSGQPLVDADPSIGHGADYVRMVTGTAMPDELVEAVERYLGLTVDHGFNNSTFAARVIASTGADVGGIISGAMASLSGPLHGGAPSRVLDMIESIGSPDNARSWTQAQLAAGNKIMGFGHAVYASEDPRSALLAETAQGLGGDLVANAIEIESDILAVMGEWKPDATIVTNVEFYAAIVLHLAGIPSQMFTATFAVSRVAGWCAHLLEQASDNKIIRPSARYVGVPPHRL